MKFSVTYELLQDKLTGGHKTMTSRKPWEKWYDWYKDVNQKSRTVIAEGYFEGRFCKRPIHLIGCVPQDLGWIAENKFWGEGFSSEEGFIDIWKKLYGTFDPELKVTTLEFKVTPIVFKNGFPTI
tara:strand:+ start:1311 stop:1685 length:375 start_codon:yes stop_codon:yes gene_type:complete